MKKSLINDYLKALNTLVNDNRISFTIIGNFSDKCHIVAYWCKNQVLHDFNLYDLPNFNEYDYYDKDKLISMIADHCKNSDYKDLLVTYLNENLNEYLEYVY